MRTASIDLESNNFLPMCDKIHVICCKMDDGEVFPFRNKGGFQSWLMSNNPERVVIHNGLGFDLLVLWIVWGMEIEVGRVSRIGEWKGQIVDTCLLSQRLNPDREGGHSLDNLAKLAGTFKQEYKGGFEEYTTEMEEYCKQDVNALWEVWKMLLKEIERL